MTAPGPMIADVADVLARFHHVSDVDPSAGRFVLHVDGRAIPVELAPSVLDEYAAQLDDSHIPELSSLPPEHGAPMRARHVARCIQELAESDLDASLRQVQLSRNDQGEIFVDGRRGPATRSAAPPAEGASWSSEPGSP